MDKPSDYEQCAHCGYDHQYEPQESAAEHLRLAQDQVDYHMRENHIPVSKMKEYDIVGVDFGDYFMATKNRFGGREMVTSWAAFLRPIIIQHGMGVKVLLVKAKAIPE